jgi:ATP-dependent helicase/nuclease subunit A
VHLLLEVLPDCTPARRAEAGRALVRARGKGLAESEQDRVLADVLRLMAEPDLAPLFGPASRAEVAVAGRLPLGPGGAPRAFSGQVDRIAITPEAVLIADYKTTSSAPRDASGLDPSHVRQVALYRALIAPLYPEKGVKALIVFTGAARSVVVPAEMMDAALAGMHETGF